MSKYRLGDYTIKNWNDWDRVPREPVTIGTAIMTALNLGAYATVSLGFGVTVAGVVGYVATTLVTSALLSALAPKPKMGSSAGSGGTLVNSKGATNPAEVVYGQIRKGGTETFIETTNTSGGYNKILHKIIVLAAHEVEEIGDIYLNDEVVTMSNENVTSAPYNGYMKIYKHTGNQTSATSPFSNSTSNLQNTLHAETSATTGFVGKGVAYLYCRLVYNQDAYANGVPNITAVVKGKKIVKTVNGTEQSATYTNNAAWVIRDFLTSSYGLDDDQIDYSTFEAAADVCDDTGIVSDNTAQYQVNGVVSLATPKGDVLTELVAACGGSLFWGGGYWKLYAGEYVAPTKTLTLDDLRGPISLTTKNPMRDNFNRVSGTFIDSSNDWISADYPAVTSSVFTTDDDGVESTMDLPLPYTTNSLAAQRLAKMMMYRSREQITLSADFGLEALGIEVGDFIKFRNDRYGWGSVVNAGSFVIGEEYEINTVGDTDFTAIGASSNAVGVTFTATGFGDLNTTGTAIDLSTDKIFEVTGWRINPDPENNDLRINLNLKETSEAAYGFSIQDENTIVSNNSSLLKYYEVPNITINASKEYREVNQNVLNALIINVTSTNPERIDSVIVKYKKSTDSDYKSVSQSILTGGGNNVGRFEVVGIEAPSKDQAPITYNVSVTPVNGFGFRGTEQSTTFDVTADTTAPSAPSSLSKTLSGGTVFLNWPAVSDLDLSHYKLYHTTNTSATFNPSSLTDLVEKIARPATSISAPALAGKFFVSAVDKTGNESTTAASVTVASAELPSLDQSQDSDEHSSFSGNSSISNVNVTVSGGKLFQTTASTGTDGIYYFSHDGNNYFTVDASTPRTVRLSYEISYDRKVTTAVNGSIQWDSIPGNWDTWPGNFETWTDETAAFNDHQVLVQARAANTVGGLSSASWVTATSEVVGQYVQFRAVLSNTNTNVTSSISTLTAIVEY